MVYTGALPQLTQQNIVLFIRSRGIGGTPPNYLTTPPTDGTPPTPAIVTFQKPTTFGSILLHVGAGGNGSGSNVRVVIGRNIVLQGSTNNKPAVVISGGATLVMEGFNEDYVPDPEYPLVTDPAHPYRAPMIVGNVNSSSGTTHRDSSGTYAYNSAGAAVGVYSGTLIMRGDSTVTLNSAGTGEWYGFRTNGVFVNSNGTLVMEQNARIEKNGYGDAVFPVQTLPGTFASHPQSGITFASQPTPQQISALVSSDVFVDKVESTTAVTPRGTLTIGDNAYIGIVSLADYGGNSTTNTSYIGIKSKMTGTANDPIRINLWRQGDVPPGGGDGPANTWLLNTEIIRPVGGYFILLEDIEQRFQLHMRTGWNSFNTGLGAITNFNVRMCNPKDSGLTITGRGIGRDTAGVGRLENRN